MVQTEGNTKVTILITLPGNTLAPYLRSMDDHLPLFNGRLTAIVYEINEETRMSIEVKGLADTVRRAKDAIRKASDSSKRMEASANELVRNLDTIEGLNGELDQANAELQAAIGQLSNGGPAGPLPDTPYGTPASDNTSKDSGVVSTDVAGSLRSLSVQG